LDVEKRLAVEAFRNLVDRLHPVDEEGQYCLQMKENQFDGILIDSASKFLMTMCENLTSCHSAM
jgi:hypothetical protein